MGIVQKPEPSDEYNILDPERGSRGILEKPREVMQIYSSASNPTYKLAYLLVMDGTPQGIEQRGCL